jgi:hypothetical protein
MRISNWRLWRYLLPFLTVRSAYSAEVLTTTNNANLLAQAALSTTGTPLTFLNATYLGGASASGTFVDGPQGFGSGTLLTTGAATGSLPSSANPAPGVDNKAAGNTLCTVTLGSASTFNAAVLDMWVNLPVGWQGITGKFIFASSEYPK